MKKIATTPLLAFSVLLAGCSLVAREGGADPRVVKMFGSAESFAAVAAESKVTAWRIEPEQAGPEKSGAADSVAGYKRISGPVEVDRKTAGALAELLQSAGSYHFDSAKGCVFRPGVVVRFESDDAAVDVLFCFSCNELAVQVDGERIGGEDFDRVRAKLVRIAKKIFPDDEAIQGLKEKD